VARWSSDRILRVGSFLPDPRRLGFLPLFLLLIAFGGGCQVEGASAPTRDEPSWEEATPPAVPRQEAEGMLQVDVLDVGQGDAILLSFPAGQRVLVDAGPSASVVAALRALGVEGLDLLILTHPHADHIGGARAVLEAFPVRFVLDNGRAHTTVTYERLLETLLRLEVPLLEPERRTLTLGDATLEILPPSEEATLDLNDSSLGVLLTFGSFRAFFGGDAEEALWAHWLEAYGAELQGPLSLLKASHHGSRNGDTAEGVRHLAPRVVLISAGANNRYGHPHPEALERYRRVGAEIWITGGQGPIRLLGGRDGTIEIPLGQRIP
jgi:competence protein ComEC